MVVRSPPPPPRLALSALCVTFYSAGHTDFYHLGVVHGNFMHEEGCINLMRGHRYINTRAK